MTEPLVSIVTPFFNTREYLAECIESVLTQTYRKFEYILVDNCSTDGSAEIARSFTETDSRIRLIHADTFRNQIQNYNYALEHISPRSTYCKIVQADDWIFPDCIAEMVAVAEQDAGIGLVSGFALVGSADQSIVVNFGLPYRKTGRFSGSEVCRKQILERRHFFGSPTSVMFRSDVVRSRRPFYRELPFEDTIACLEILREWDFGFVYRVVVFQRTGNESIMKRIRGFDPCLLLEPVATVSTAGAGHLSPQEYSEAVRLRENAYYRFLARQAISGRKKEFWDYHREGLAKLRIELGWRVLWKYVMWQLFDKVLNPKRTVEQLVAQRKRKNR